MSDTFVNVMFFHFSRDPLVAVRFSDRALVDDCKLYSALIVKPSHSDKWYEVPHGFEIYPFVLTNTSDLSSVEIAIHTSVFIVTGNISQTIVCMFTEFWKMEQFIQSQR